jgi:feruloyl esterase
MTRLWGLGLVSKGHTFSEPKQILSSRPEEANRASDALLEWRDLHLSSLRKEPTEQFDRQYLERTVYSGIRACVACSRAAIAVLREVNIRTAKLLLTGSALLLATCPLLAQQDCAKLAAMTLPQAKITSAELIPAAVDKTPSMLGQPQTLDLPAYCKVKAEAMPTADSDIKFEVWMPVASAWNGEYLQLGNGGLAGSIGYPLMNTQLSHHFAVAATDDGHEAQGTDGAWAIGHPEKVIDFAYRAVHLTNVHARAILEAFYGHKQKYAYFNGCSEGGREAMMEAQRYPDDFNGILAGSSAHDWMGLMADFAWNAQALGKDAASYIPEAKRSAIEKAALKQCGTQDGVTDSFIQDPQACHFDPSVLLCKAADSDDCLTQPQLTALEKIYSGAKDPVTGKQISVGYEPGPEAEPGFPGISYASYIYGPKQNATLHLAFSSSFYGGFVFEKPGYLSLTLDFHKDIATADAKVGAIMNAMNPDLKPFKAHGGKLLQYHGWYDGSPAPMQSVEYHQAVVRAMGGERKVDDFYRLFMVPGMMHCGMGPGPNAFGDMLDSSHYGDPEHDIFAALRGWVEDNRVPAEIIATKFTNDVATQPVLMTRPLCPYPEKAMWDGKGDTKVAASFSCKK